MTEHPQLTLPVSLRDDATFSSFLFPPVLQPLQLVLEAQLNEGEQFVYLHGAAGSGRSHLLQAACHSAPAGAALFLPLDQLSEMRPDDVLAGVESLALLSLDNLHSVVGRSDWEEALFHLFNRVRESGSCMLVSADCAPRQLSVELPDLQSRLSSGVVFRLEEPDDEAKREILQFRARQRGMNLGEETSNYIFARAGRSLPELIAILEQLDSASMAAQRQLSIPFVRETLGW